MADLTSLKETYQDLLIVQYRIKPKARATIGLMVEVASGDGLPLDLARCFDLNTAIGAQLDIIGRIVGVPRQVYGLDLTHTYFSFMRYTDLTPPGKPGFGRYNYDPYPQHLWRRYIETSILYMTDFEMINVIRIKIIQNNAYSSLKDIADALWLAFGDNISIVDNTNMTLDYHATEAYRRVILIAQFLDILPRPMGVALNVTADSTSSSSSCSSSSSSCRSSSSSSSCRSSSSSCSSCRSSSSSSSCRSSSSSCRSSSSSSSSCRSSSSSSSSAA